MLGGQNGERECTGRWWGASQPPLKLGGGNHQALDRGDLGFCPGLYGSPRECRGGRKKKISRYEFPSVWNHETKSSEIGIPHAYLGLEIGMWDAYLTYIWAMTKTPL